MQKLYSHFLRLFVAAAAIVAVSSAHAGVDELPTGVQDSLTTQSCLIQISRLGIALTGTGLPRIHHHGR